MTDNTQNTTRNTHRSISLPENVAKDFQISGENARRKCHWRKHRKIDLNNITVEKAEQLVKEGFPYLEKRDESSPYRGDKRGAEGSGNSQPATGNSKAGGKS